MIKEQVRRGWYLLMEQYACVRRGEWKCRLKDTRDLSRTMTKQQWPKASRQDGMPVVVCLQCAAAREWGSIRSFGDQQSAQGCVGMGIVSFMEGPNASHHGFPDLRTDTDGSRLSTLGGTGNAAGGCGLRRLCAAYAEPQPFRARYPAAHAGGYGEGPALDSAQWRKNRQGRLRVTLLAGLGKHRTAMIGSFGGRMGGVDYDEPRGSSLPFELSPRPFRNWSAACCHCP